MLNATNIVFWGPFFTPSFALSPAFESRHQTNATQPRTKTSSFPTGRWPVALLGGFCLCGRWEDVQIKLEDVFNMPAVCSGSGHYAPACCVCLRACVCVKVDA